MLILLDTHWQTTLPRKRQTLTTYRTCTCTDKEAQVGWDLLLSRRWWVVDWVVRWAFAVGKFSLFTLLCWCRFRRVVPLLVVCGSYSYAIERRCSANFRQDFWGVHFCPAPTLDALSRSFQSKCWSSTWTNRDQSSLLFLPAFAIRYRTFVYKHHSHSIQSIMTLLLAFGHNRAIYFHSNRSSFFVAFLSLIFRDSTLTDPLARHSRRSLFYRNRTISGNAQLSLFCPCLVAHMAEFIYLSLAPKINRA